MMKTSLYAALALVAVTLGTTRLDAQQVARAYRIQECGRIGIAFHDESMTIHELMPGSPAHRAGLRPGDVVVKVGDAEASRASMQQVADTLRPGSPLLLRVRRGDQEADVEIVAARDFCLRIVADTIAAGTLNAIELERIVRRHGNVDAAEVHQIILRQAEAEAHEHRRIVVRLEDTDPIAVIPGATPLTLRSLDIGLRAIAGAEFSGMDPHLAAYFDGAPEGLLVLRVAPDTPAARAGLLPGDVLVSAAGSPIREIARLRFLIATATDRPIPITVVRKGEVVELEM